VIFPPEGIFIGMEKMKCKWKWAVTKKNLRNVLDKRLRKPIIEWANENSGI
jgi:hypothetical protein